MNIFTKCFILDVWQGLEYASWKLLLLCLIWFCWLIFNILCRPQKWLINHFIKFLVAINMHYFLQNGVVVKLYRPNQKRWMEKQELYFFSGLYFLVLVLKMEQCFQKSNYFPAGGKLMKFQEVVLCINPECEQMQNREKSIVFLVN